MDPRERHAKAIDRIQRRIGVRFAALSEQVASAVIEEAGGPDGTIDAASYNRIMNRVDEALNGIYPPKKGSVSAFEGDIVEEAVRTRREVQKPILDAIASALDNPS